MSRSCAAFKRRIDDYFLGFVPYFASHACFCKELLRSNAMNNCIQEWGYR